MEAGIKKMTDEFYEKSRSKKSRSQFIKINRDEFEKERADRKISATSYEEEINEGKISFVQRLRERKISQSA